MSRREITFWLALSLLVIANLIYTIASTEQPKKEDEQITEIKNYHNSEGKNVIVFE